MVTDYSRCGVSIKGKFGTLVIGVPRISAGLERGRPLDGQRALGLLPGRLADGRELRYTKQAAKSARSTLWPLSGKFVTCAASDGRACDVVPGRRRERAGAPGAREAP